MRIPWKGGGGEIAYGESKALSGSSPSLRPMNRPGHRTLTQVHEEVSVNRYRSVRCGELGAGELGQVVAVAGWMSVRRNHGHMMFLHLRDASGSVQVVVQSADEGAEPLEQLRHIQLESVLRVQGLVRPRPKGQENPDMSTGHLEVLLQQVEVLSPVIQTPPFSVEKGAEAGEELRLKYRYLDLRRSPMRDMLFERDRLSRAIRETLGARGFLEVNTPILSNSSPEGARDFLVPSRLQPGNFFALPQAPQQWKQLLMASGVDRYFQIAPCFRDEAARADRSPGEFYQLDLEMAFVEQEDVLQEAESSVIEIAQRFDGSALPHPFPRLGYAEALERFGSDKPDLRFGLELVTLTEFFKGSSVSFLRAAVDGGGAVRGLPVPAAAQHFPRRSIDELRALAQESGVTGLAWIVWTEAETRGSLAGAMDEQEMKRLGELLGAKEGTLLLVCAGPRDRIDVALSALRNEVGERLGLRDPKQLLFSWITDFPMYEWDEESQHVVFSHNPFSMPQGGLEALNTADPLEILGWQYDLVCNGVEISSGAIRNSEPETLYRAFEIAGYSRAAVDREFGHMIEAFRNGTPPHGGIAPGFERLLMLFKGATSIREVVPFPKNQRCQDLLVGSPSPVEPGRLRELGLQLNRDTKAAG